MRPFPTRRRPLVALPLAALLAASAPLPLSAQRRFEDTAQVVVVEIPVQVTRDGKPVRGLTADDFEVFEGRKKHDIVGFDVVDLSLADDRVAPADVPSSARRHFLLLFDLALSYPAAILRAREAARQLVETALHPTDLVAVAVYSANRGAELRLGFTSDRAQVALAIDTLGMPQLVSASAEPLGIVLADRQNLLAGPSAGGGGGGVSGDRASQAEAELVEILEGLERDSQRVEERNKVLSLTGSLTELAAMMAAVDGRKHVVFLSEGFDSSVLLGGGVGTEEERQRMAQQAEAAASGAVWEVKSDDRFGNTSTLNQLEAMTRGFLEADCTIQSVDIGGLRAENDTRARRSSDDGLHMMADKTGGEYYRNFNDLGAAMGQMLERTSVTYVLAIQPEKLKADGKFRRLKIKFKGDERGVRVAARPGYFAPKPPSEMTARERQLATADLLLAGRDGGGIQTSVLAAPFEVSASSAYVPVLLEIDGGSLLGNARDGVVAAEIYAYAIGADGSVVDYFTQISGLDVAKVGDALRQGGFKFWGHFELPPGDYSVRTLVRNTAADSVGVRSTPLKVPAVERTESALLPPFFPEPRGKWLLGREKDLGQNVFEYPFMLDGQAFIPAAKPVVRAGEAQQVALVGYNLGAGALTLDCRLLTWEGKPLAGARMDLEGRDMGSSPGQDRLVARFRADGVAAGEYTLEVTVRDGDSGRSQTARIPLVVAG